jgi:hypothetical protein
MSDMPTLCRSLLALAVVTLASSPALHAAEPPASAAPADAKVDLPPARRQEAGSQPVTVDPMQDLRERLAARLRTKASEGKVSVLRVSTAARWRIATQHAAPTRRASRASPILP